MNSMIRWVNKADPPLSTAAQSGDSNSPLFIYDAIANNWKLIGATVFIEGNSIYAQRTSASVIEDAFINSVITANQDADVTDNSADGDIHWRDENISQGNKQWQWHGLNASYASADPASASASNEELDATKDLRFNGEGGTVFLDQPVNMGAGKLQFSNDYLFRSAEGANATWVGGGVEVDSGKTVLWQVNGNARINLKARSTLDGRIELVDTTSAIYADISEGSSTADELASTINSEIDGQGSLYKTGDGQLTLNGQVSAAGGIRLEQGELEVNNAVTSALQMAQGTLPGGKGTLASINMADSAMLYPGRWQRDADDWATLRVRNLLGHGSNSVRLNTGFAAGKTDRLLIAGDINTDAPITVSVAPQASWTGSSSTSVG